MQLCNVGEKFSPVNTIRTGQIGVDFQSGYRVQAESMTLYFLFSIGTAWSFLGGGGRGEWRGEGERGGKELCRRTRQLG